MRFSRTLLLAASCFILTTHALPRPKPDVTYSVVNVDGGSQTAAPTPTIIYQTITKSDDTPATISVTITDHQTQTQIQSAQTTQTQTAVIPEVSQHPDGHPPHHLPRPKPTTTTVVSEGETVTVTSVITPTAATSTKYYDNGQWHTSYAVKNWSSQWGSHPGQWQPSASSGYAAASGYAAPSGGY